MSHALQTDLFNAAAAPILPGLSYVRDVLSEAQEDALVRAIETLDLEPFAFRGFTGNRRTASFGWRYDFSGGGFRPAEPLPEFLLELRGWAAEILKLDPQALVQASAIEYAPGAGIGWHRDRPQFGEVIGISLRFPCRMRFRRERKEGGWERAALMLERRSLYRLEGEARSLWQHSIPALEALRYSVTFRTLSSLGASFSNR